MNDFNEIIKKYKNASACLIKISENITNFKALEHSIIFSYLLCHFSKRFIDVKDLSNILYFYKKGSFNKTDFFENFKKIAFIFSNYFSSKDKLSNIEEDIKIENNNQNNINEINNNYFIKKNVSNKNNKYRHKNPIKKNNFNSQNNYNNFINKTHTNFMDNIDNANNEIDLNNKNDNFINNYNSIDIDNNDNINNNAYSNHKYRKAIHNANSKNYNFNYKGKKSQSTYDLINNDYQLAKQIEEEEKILFQIQANKDAQKQIKKCEICLEDFSLLDNTNYFLNYNCVIHNKCFDEMVKSAVESNNLPIKCPNCGTDIHPNFIEDSISNANPQLINKYDKFSWNNFLQKNRDEYSSCPTPGCEYMFFFEPGEINFLCPWCSKNYCLNCKDEWHRGMTCKQYKDSRDVNLLDNQFYQFVKGAKFKMCPRCKFWVEKNQGCNHMKCRCGADFCYLCGSLMDMTRPHICNSNV